jgi:hypothetical protein
MNNLSMRQEMAIYDSRGNCRCPWCGKYRKREDFDAQPGSVWFGDEHMSGHLSLLPGCRYCLEDD